MRISFRHILLSFLSCTIFIITAAAYTSPESSFYGESSVLMTATLYNTETSESITIPIEVDNESIQTYSIDGDAIQTTINADINLFDILSNTRATQNITDLDRSSSVRGSLTLTYSYQNGDRDYIRLDKVSGSFTTNVSRLDIYDTTVSPGQCCTSFTDSDLIPTRVNNTFSLNTGFTRYVNTYDPNAMVGCAAKTYIDYRESSWTFELEHFIVDNGGLGLGDLIH